MSLIGGKKILLNNSGKDVSEQFWQFHNESILNKVASNYKIGQLASSSSSNNADKTEAKAEEQEEEVDELDEQYFGELVPFGGKMLRIPFPRLSRDQC